MTLIGAGDRDAPPTNDAVCACPWDNTVFSDEVCERTIGTSSGDGEASDGLCAAKSCSMPGLQRHKMTSHHRERDDTRRRPVQHHNRDGQVQPASLKASSMWVLVARPLHARAHKEMDGPSGEMWTRTA